MGFSCALARSVKFAGLLGLGLGLCVLASEPAEAASIAPHIAVYDIKLSKLRADRGVTHASGRIEFELADGCDGWLTKQRTHLFMSSSEGQPIDTGWIFTAWEAKDGLAYRFEVKRLNAGGELEEIRGKAQLSGKNEGGSVTYSLPEEESRSLPPGTMFPAQHNLDIMRAAAADEFLLWREVFDGAGDEGLFGINAAVLQAMPSELESFDSPLIEGVPSWRVQLAYYPENDQASEPNYQQGQRLYANGVVDELEFDYSDFTLSAKLQSLEALPAADCQ